MKNVNEEDINEVVTQYMFEQNDSITRTEIGHRLIELYRDDLPVTFEDLSTSEMIDSGMVSFAVTDGITVKHITIAPTGKILD